MKNYLKYTLLCELSIDEELELFIRTYSTLCCR